MTRRRLIRAAVAGLVLLAQFVVYSQVTAVPDAEAAPSVAQVYYTPFEAQQFMDLLRSEAGNPGCCSGNIISTISITSGADGNTIYYDHFEDGYEADPLNPVQASTLTLSLDAGAVWTQTSTIGVDPRVAGNFFDGRDKVVSTAAIAMTQTGYASNPGTYHAGGVQVLDLDKSGTRFDIPIGENADFNSVFQYVGFVVVSTADATTVDVDADANGSFETQVVLAEGETYFQDGGVSLGAAVQSDNPVSVYLGTGDEGATYEGRLFELYPTSIWADDMVSPVGSQSVGDGTRVFVFNPGAAAITIDVFGHTGLVATLPVPAGGQVNYLMPVDHGARFVSQGGEPFYGLQAISTEGADTSAFDWGFTLVPGIAVTPSVIVPYGPGSEGLTNNYNPVWVAATADTTLYVDLDGDPDTGPNVDAVGDRYDFSCAAGAYDSITIYDDGTTNCYLPSQDAANNGDRDMTGARIYTLDGARLSAAWGQRPNYNPGLPALDMGTTILPFPQILMTKSSVLTNDVDGDGVADAGDEIEYTVTMENLGIVDIGAVVLTDETPAYTSYVPSSTTLEGVPVADDGGAYSLSPNDADSPSGGLSVGVLPAGIERSMSYRITVDTPIPFGVYEVVNIATMTTQYGSSTAVDRRPVDVPPLQILKDSTPTSSPVGSADTITYTVRVYNGDASAQTGVDVVDTLPSGVTYVPASVAADIDGTPTAAGDPPNLVTGATLPAGAILTITFDVDVDAPIGPTTTEFTNLAEASSNEYPTPVSDTAVDPAGPVVDLSLDKVDDEVAPLSPGDRLVYTLTATNAGPDAAHDVVVVDTLPPQVTFVPAASDASCVEAPAGTITCPLGDLGVTSTSFDIAVDVNAGVDGTFTNFATVTSSSPEGNPGDEDASEDTTADSPPSLTVTKTPSPSSVPEPGGTVTFSVAVENTSVEAVTLTALTDDVFGDLLDGANPNVSANTCLTAGPGIGIGGTLNCSFDAFVAGDASDPAHVDTVTATVEDDEGNTSQDSGQASVTFDDVAPTVVVTKSVVPGSVPESGGMATFSVAVDNTSVEAVMLTALSDDVFGDLLDGGNPNVLSNSCATAGPGIAIGGTLNCSFDAFVAGDASGPNHVDTVTATVTDDDGTTGQDFDSASVSFTDVAPTILVTKTPSPSSVPEPGGTVTFSVAVENTSSEPVNLTALTDDVFGDLLDGANPNVSANTCLTAGPGIGIGGTLNCSFDAFVAGDASDPAHVDTVTATVEDAEGTAGQDSDQASVTFDDVAPTITVTKSPSVGTVSEPGGMVTFSVTVLNTSVEDVTLVSLSDDVFGDLLDVANPAVSANDCPGQATTLAVGATLACSFDAFVAGGASGPDHFDTVTATVTDDEGNNRSEYDSATVGFDDVLPSVTVTKDPSVASIDEPGGVVTFDLTLYNGSVEDVTILSLSDDVYGDLLDPFNAVVANNTCELLPATMGPDVLLTCSFDALVIGDASGPDHGDTVTFSGEDDEANVATDQDSATVAFDDVAPTAVVEKTPSAGTVTEPGGTVTFTVRITNTTIEDLTIDALTDDVFGDLRDGGNPAISNNTCDTASATIAPDETVECSFDAVLSGFFGDPDHVDTVTATLSDDEGTTITPSDDAVVAFAPANSTVSGLVFTDLDLDGVRDAGENGLGGIDIVVTDSGGTPTTVTTAADGTWQVSVLPGAVTIDVDEATVPADYTLTTANAIQVLGALAGQDVAAEDIGYGPPTGSISGTIFMDLDGDPDHDGYEPTFEGVTVTLLDDGGSVVASIDTDSNGYYEFIDLIVGSYTVVVDGTDVGVGYVGSVDPDGTLDDETDVVVGIGAAITGVDFGYAGTASIGDTVWIDANEDGVIDIDESVLPGAVVTVIWAGPDGAIGTADDYDFGSRTSDGNGWYRFDALPPGVYRVSVSVDDVALTVTPTTPTVVTTSVGAGEAWVLGDFGFATDGELPFTGLDAEHLLLAAALMLGLAGLVLADGRKRNRHFDIALERIEG